MKNILKTTIKIVTLLLVFFSAVILPACNDNPDEFTTTAGKPKVDYIRLPDITKSDSLVTHAFMEITIAIMGENLTSVKEVWFNDQMAILNTSFITSSALIVPVPSTIPTKVTNKIYLVSASGDTVKVDFGVDVPAPLLSSMKCERVAAGGTAVIFGNFFINDPNIPLQVFFPGNIEGEILSVDLHEVHAVVPEGVGSGQIVVKSIYGSTRSSFFFRDDRNIFLNFDNLTSSGSWRAGTTRTDENSLDGNYVMLKGEQDDNVGSEDFSGGGFVCELWGDANGRPIGNFLPGSPDDYLLKFEANVIEWSGAYLNICWGPWASSVAGYQNQLYWSDINARGLWRPWESNGGSYMSDGWITVTIPMTDMKYNKDFGALDFDPLKTGSMTLWMKGPAATTGGKCKMEVYLDNFRIVPKK